MKYNKRGEGVGINREGSDFDPNDVNVSNFSYL